MLLAFRMSRSLRAVQLAQWLSFYKPKEIPREVIVTWQEAKRWFEKKHRTSLIPPGTPELSYQRGEFDVER